MKKLILAIVLMSLFSCETTEKPESSKYFSALYFRYIADSQEAKLEFMAKKGDTPSTATPYLFQDSVLYNGHLMTVNTDGNPIKYTWKTRDEFPMSIHFQVKDLIDFEMKPPMLKKFVAKLEGDVVSLHSTTTISKDDQLALIMVDESGVNITKNIKGPIQFPYRFSLDPKLTQPVTISPLFQKRLKNVKGNITTTILLEYYAPDMLLDESTATTHF